MMPTSSNLPIQPSLQHHAKTKILDMDASVQFVLIVTRCLDHIPVLQCPIQSRRSVTSREVRSVPEPMLNSIHPHPLRVALRLTQNAELLLQPKEFLITEVCVSRHIYGRKVVMMKMKVMWKPALLVERSVGERRLLRPSSPSRRDGNSLGA